MALGNIVESFFVYLGFELGEEELKEWTEKLHDVENITMAVGAVAIAASASIAVMVNEFAESIGELKEFAERNEESVEAVQELGFASSVTGGSLEEAKSSIQGLTQKIGEAALGIGRGAMIFKKLQLEAKGANGEVKTADELMGELSARMQKMSTQEAQGMGRRLGLTPAFIQLLKQGSDNLETLREEARKYGVVSDDDAKVAVTLHNAWTRVHYLLRATGAAIAVQLMPPMLRLVNSVIKWTMANRQAIGSGLVTFIKLVNIVLGTMWDWLERVASGISFVVKWMTQWHWVSYTLLGVLAAIITAGFIEMLESTVGWVMKVTKGVLELDLASAGWALLLGGLVLAIGLIIDDLWNYYHGNESLIGQLQKEFPHALAIAQTALVVLSGLLVAMKWDAIATAASVVASMVTMAASFAMAVPEAVALSLAMIGIDIPASVILLIILAIVAAIAALIFIGYEVYKHWGTIMEWFHKSWDTLSEKIHKFIEDIKEAAGAVRDFLGGDGSGNLNWKQQAVIGLGGPLGALAVGGGVLGRASQAGGGTTVHRETHNHVPITVISPDPDRAGDAVQRSMQDLHGSVIRDGQEAVGW
jgi:hypothetical protein